MLYVLVVMCLVGKPEIEENCHKFVDDSRASSPTMCMIHGKLFASAYTAEHPTWQLSEVRCSKDPPEDDGEPT
jgi:hypothetical protein